MITDIQDVSMFVSAWSRGLTMSILANNEDPEKYATTTIFSGDAVFKEIIGTMAC